MLSLLARATLATALVSLSVACGPQVKPIDEKIDGALSASSTILTSDDSYFDEYLFTVKKGMLIEANLQSDHFDTYLILVPPDGSKEPMNDDCIQGEPESGSCLSITSHIDGEWRIIANSFGPGETGAYTLEYKTSKP